MKAHHRGYISFVLVIMVTVMAGRSASASDSEASSEEERFKRHKLTLAYGYTNIPEGKEEEGGEKGIWVPSAGLDYFYRLNEKWELGAAADIEFAEYLIIDKDLSRDYAFILIALAGYELVPFWAVFGGAGIELEKHKNLPVFRLGTEYEFMFKRDWLIAPGVLVDYKEEFYSWSIYVAGGKVF